MPTLRLVLGDQLNQHLSSLRDVDAEHDVVLMCEIRSETDYVKHHKKKIAFVFSAMRHFAHALEESGVRVRYIRFDDPDNCHSFEGEIQRALSEENFERIVVTEAGEFRLSHAMKDWETTFSLPVEIREDDRFLCTHCEFEKWADGRKQLRMEYFYREMRKKYNVLMENGKPVGGKWNYDSENRKPPKDSLFFPKTYSATPDTITQKVIDLVAEHFDDHFGDLLPFHFAVTRDQALQALDQFIDERLIHFGDYQDAMVQGQAWMYHSHVSFYLNCGLLLPLECIEKAEAAYRSGQAPLNAVEGFVRQILGWREYVRGIYWLNMPDYESQNFLQASRPLPEFFWSGNTPMNCIKQCVTETREHAYAHHIQRLMVLGNFALIAGIHPDEVNNWFMVVYADAYQWVELPNVTGMVLFADGGELGSKPYAASGAYINKMSNYCQGCDFNVKEKNGETACPFNYLYWDFIIRNRDKLEENPRMGMIYRTLGRMSEEKIELIQKDAKRFLSDLNVC